MVRAAAALAADLPERPEPVGTEAAEAESAGIEDVT